MQVTTAKMDYEKLASFTITTYPKKKSLLYGPTEKEGAMIHVFHHSKENEKWEKDMWKENEKKEEEEDERRKGSTCTMKSEREAVKDEAKEIRGRGKKQVRRYSNIDN